MAYQLNVKAKSRRIHDTMHLYLYCMMILQIVILVLCYRKNVKPQQKIRDLKVARYQRANSNRLYYRAENALHFHSIQK